MPWIQGWLFGADGKKICARFSVSSIPRPFLVDATGRIIAMENELRGPALDAALQRAFR